MIWIDYMVWFVLILFPLLCRLWRQSQVLHRPTNSSGSCSDSSKRRTWCAATKKETVWQLVGKLAYRMFSTLIGFLASQATLQAHVLPSNLWTHPRQVFASMTCKVICRSCALAENKRIWDMRSKKHRNTMKYLEKGIANLGFAHYKSRLQLEGNATIQLDQRICFDLFEWTVDLMEGLKLKCAKGQLLGNFQFVHICWAPAMFERWPCCEAALFWDASILR